jgi:hypothetical protein
LGVWSRSETMGCGVVFCLKSISWGSFLAKHAIDHIALKMVYIVSMSHILFWYYSLIHTSLHLVPFFIHTLARVADYAAPASFLKIVPHYHFSMTHLVNPYCSMALFCYDTVLKRCFDLNGVSRLAALLEMVLLAVLMLQRQVYIIALEMAQLLFWNSLHSLPTWQRLRCIGKGRSHSPASLAMIVLHIYLMMSLLEYSERVRMRDHK